MIVDSMGLSDRAALTGHGEVGGDGGGIAALGTGRRGAALRAHAAAPHVLLAEARLAAQARVLPDAVARLTCTRTSCL